MERIKKYFENVETCQISDRRIGIETESLAVNKWNRKPISLDTSQRMMRRLIEEYGYKIIEEKNNLITRVEKGGFEIFYELGWNNFELITPPFLIDDINALSSEHDRALQELNFVGESSGVETLNTSWDGYYLNSLVMPDKRDEIWLKLDGPALYPLGHIASIHLNIDLVSIDEGMKWIKILNDYFRKVQWPANKNEEIWKRYLALSMAEYEKTRYGQPPENFSDYCRKLSEYKVVMNRSNGELEIMKPVKSFTETANVDFDLFIRSVWWWSRLRVRNGKLVLEIRDIPRTFGAKKALLIIKRRLLL